MTTQLEQAWELAKQRFAAVGIDVEEALRQLDRLPVSMHCWQGDDVSGFENPEGSLTGGIQATGNYPGKARNLLFAMVEIESEERWNAVASTDVCQRWWKYMTDVMPANPDNSPVSSELQEVFYLP